MLKVVLLYVVCDIVDLHRADHRAESEHRGALLDRGLAVEGTLGVHQEDADLVVQ